MPQGDLNDVKVSCETLAPIMNDDNDDTLADPVVVMIPPPPPDYAPESFWLSKDAELDWLDRNAFLDRKDSGKGSQQGTSSSNPNLVHGSQRYSANNNLKSKASLIALPKPQKQNYAEVKNRRHCSSSSSRPSSARLFPKRAEPAGTKPGLALSEPGSPKVSCMGRVRSRKDRKNRKKEKKAVLVRVKSVKERKPGFWKNFRSIFRAKGSVSSNNNLGSNEDRNDGGDFAAVTRKKSSGSRKKRGFDSNSNINSDDNNRGGPSEPPGLGGMKRFASGRKSDGWAGDVGFDGAQSEPLDSRGGGPIWRRREVGPPVDVEVDRDWRSVGPVSV